MYSTLASQESSSAQAVTLSASQQNGERRTGTGAAPEKRECESHSDAVRSSFQVVRSGPRPAIVAGDVVFARARRFLRDRKRLPKDKGMFHTVGWPAIESTSDSRAWLAQSSKALVLGESPAKRTRSTPLRNALSRSR